MYRRALSQKAQKGSCALSLLKRVSSICDRMLSKDVPRKHVSPVAVPMCRRQAMTVCLIKQLPGAVLWSTFKQWVFCNCLKECGDLRDHIPLVSCAPSSANPCEDLSGLVPPLVSKGFVTSVGFAQTRACKLLQTRACCLEGKILRFLHSSRMQSV